MAKHCINTNSSHFKNMAKQLGVSESLLDNVLFKYTNMLNKPEAWATKEGLEYAKNKIYGFPKIVSRETYEEIQKNEYLLDNLSFENLKDAQNTIQMYETYFPQNALFILLNDNNKYQIKLKQFTTPVTNNLIEQTVLQDFNAKEETKSLIYNTINEMYQGAKDKPITEIMIRESLVDALIDKNLPIDIMSYTKLKDGSYAFIVNEKVLNEFEKTHDIKKEAFVIAHNLKSLIDNKIGVKTNLIKSDDKSIPKNILADNKICFVKNGEAYIITDKISDNASVKDIAQVFLSTENYQQESVKQYNALNDLLPAFVQNIRTKFNGEQVSKEDIITATLAEAFEGTELNKYILQEVINNKLSSKEAKVFSNKVRKITNSIRRQVNMSIKDTLLNKSDITFQATNTIVETHLNSYSLGDVVNYLLKADYGVIDNANKKNKLNEITDKHDTERIGLDILLAHFNATQIKEVCRDMQILIKEEITKDRNISAQEVFNKLWLRALNFIKPEQELFTDILLNPEVKLLLQQYVESMYNSSSTDKINLSQEYNRTNLQQDAEQIQESEVESVTEDLFEDSDSINQFRDTEKGIEERMTEPVKDFLTSIKKENLFDIFGFPKRYRYKEVTQLVTNIISNSNSVEQMLDKLAQSKKYLAKQIYNRLQQEIANNNSVFVANFFSTFSNNKRNYSEIIYGVPTSLNDSIDISIQQGNYYLAFANNKIPLFQNEKVNEVEWERIKGIKAGMWNMGTRSLTTSTENIYQYLANINRSDIEAIRTGKKAQEANAVRVINMLTFLNQIGFNYNINDYVEQGEGTIIAHLTNEEIADLAQACWNICSRINEGMNIPSWHPYFYQTGIKARPISNDIGTVLTTLSPDKNYSLTFYKAGDMRQTFAAPSFLTTLANKINSLNNEKRKEFLANEYKSEWFQHTDEKGNVVFRLPIFLHLVNKGLNITQNIGYNNNPYLKMGRAQLMDTIMIYYFQTQYNKNTKNYTLFPVPLQADKQANDFIELPVYDAQQVFDGLYNIIEQEIERIITINERQKLNLDKSPKTSLGLIDANGNKFNYFPILNLLLQEQIPDSPLFEGIDVQTTSDILKTLIGQNVEEINKLPQNRHSILKQNLCSILKNYYTQEYNDYRYNHPELFEYIKKHLNKFRDLNEAQKELELKKFYFNYVFNSLQMQQLFTGDIAQYENHIQFQKRNLQLHSSGRRGWTNVKDFDGNPVTDGIHRSIEIEDISSYFNGEWAKSELKGKISPQLYKDIVEGLSERKINSTDGQTLSNIDSIRKKMLIMGSWTNENEMLYKHYKGIAPLKEEEVQELLRRGAGVTIQKSFIYGLINKDANLPADSTSPIKTFTIGKQYKTSDFTIPPSIEQKETTDEDTVPNVLGVIARVMSEIQSRKGIQGIDSISWVSSSKVNPQGVIPIMDILNDKSLSAKEKEEKLYKRLMDKGEGYIFNEDGSYNKNVVHEMSFDNYQIQHPIHNHFNLEKQGVSGQLRTAIETDIPFEYNGEKVEITLNDGTQLDKHQFITEVEQTVSAINNMAIQDITEEFELDGNRQLSKAVLIEKLKEKLNTDYNNDLELQSALHAIDSFVSVNSPAVKSLLEQCINSIVRSQVTKFPISGGNITQVTSADSNLQIVYNENGNIEYVEVKAPLPIELESYRDKKTGVVDMDRIEKECPDALYIVLNRTPLSGLSSLYKGKIVEFTDRFSGDYIQAPKEILNLSSSDFDGDKLYAYRKSAITVNGSASISYDTNTRIGLENHFIDLVMGLLTTNAMLNKQLIQGDPEKLNTFANKIQAYKQGSFKTLEEALMSKQKTQINTPSIFTPQGQMYFYGQNADGKDLIGVFASQKGSCGIFQEMFDIYIEVPFTLFGKQYANNMPLDTMFNEAGEYISENLSLSMNSATDGAKNPALSSMNINMDTVNIYTTLLRLGVGREDTWRFMSQDVIKQLYDMYNIETNNNSLKCSFNTFITNKIKFNSVGTLTSYDLSRDIIEENILPQDITIQKEMEDGKWTGKYTFESANQANYLALHIMKTLVGVSNTIRQLDSYSRLNSASGIAPRNTLANNIHKLSALKPELNGLFIHNSEEVVTDEYIFGEKPMLKSFYDAFGLVNRILSNQIENSSVFNSTLSTYNDADILRQHIVGNQEFINNYTNFLSTLVTMDFIGLNKEESVRILTEIGNDIATLKQDEETKDNALIKYLVPQAYRTKGSVVNKINIANGVLNNEDIKSDITEGWRQLLNNKKTRDFALDLYKYCLLRGGTNNTGVSFIQLAPVSLTLQWDNTQRSLADALDNVDNYVNSNEFLQHYNIIDLFISNFANKEGMACNLIKLDGQTQFIRDGKLHITKEGYGYGRPIINSPNGLYVLTNYSAEECEYKQIKKLYNNNEYIEVYQNITDKNYIPIAEDIVTSITQRRQTQLETINTEEVIDDTTQQGTTTETQSETKIQEFVDSKTQDFSEQVKEFNREEAMDMFSKSIGVSKEELNKDVKKLKDKEDLCY